MFLFKKPTLAIYNSEATGAEFKFRHCTEKDSEELDIYVGHEGNFNNQSSLWTNYAMHRDDYHAAWLLEDFSGVQQDGKAHDIKQFDLRSKAELIQKLKEADAKFSPWFEAHCEPAEKKIEEVASSGEVVDAGTVPAVQSQQLW